MFSLFQIINSKAVNNDNDISSDKKKTFVIMSACLKDLAKIKKDQMDLLMLSRLWHPNDLRVTLSQ